MPGAVKEEKGEFQHVAIAINEAMRNPPVSKNTQNWHGVEVKEAPRGGTVQSMMGQEEDWPDNANGNQTCQKTSRGRNRDNEK